jgi:hypothetical protein
MTDVQSHLDALRDAVARHARALDRLTAAQADYAAARAQGFPLQAAYDAGSVTAAAPELRHYWAMRARRARATRAVQRHAERLRDAARRLAVAQSASAAHAHVLAEGAGPVPSVPTPGA